MFKILHSTIALMVNAAFSTTEVVYHIERSLNKCVTLISVPSVA